MSPDSWLVYATAVLALMSTPGPSHLLMLSNSATHGFKRSLATVAGDLTANALQMLAAGLGLAALLGAHGQALFVIKWLGVGYLIWLGVRMIHRGDVRVSSAEGPGLASLKILWLQGFVTSASNPKAIVFFAALFPQFIDPDTAFWPQLAILSVTYIVMDGTFLCAYGIASDRIAALIGGPLRAWVGRVGGGLMIGAALLLGLKTIRQSG